MTAQMHERHLFISPEAAAEYLNVSTRTIRRRIADGTLPAYRVGRLVKINPEDLDRLARPIGEVAA